MSKVQSLQSNYQPTLRQGQTKFAQAPSFGNNLPGGEEVKDLFTAVKKGITTRVMTISDFLAKNEGEVENQAINAVFTSTLAPLMIAFNPYSDKPKKDKEYLAWRQPISAVIALAGGLPATVIINNIISKWGSEGSLKSYDMRIAPHKDYLKKDFDAVYKKAKNNNTLTTFENEIGLDEEAKAMRDSGFNLFKKLFYKASLKECYTKMVQKEATEFFAEVISAPEGQVAIRDGKVAILDKNGNIKNKKVKNSAGEEISVSLSRKIPNITTQSELDEYLKHNSLYKAKFGDFLKEQSIFEFYSNGKLKPDSTEAKLMKIKAMDFLRSIGFVDKKEGFGEAELTKIMGIKRQIDQTVKGLDVAYSGCTSKPNLEILSDTFGQQAASISRTHQGAVEAGKETYTLGEFFHRLGYEGKNAKGEDQLQELMKKSTFEVLNEIADKLRNVPVTEKPGKKDVVEVLKNKQLIDWAKNIMTERAAKAGENFKNVMKFSGLGANIFITMATCTILNWAYPKVVKKIAPHLLVKDQPSEKVKGGNK